MKSCGSMGRKVYSVRLCHSNTCSRRMELISRLRRPFRRRTAHDDNRHPAFRTRPNGQRPVTQLDGHGRFRQHASARTPANRPGVAAASPHAVRRSKTMAWAKNSTSFGSLSRGPGVEKVALPDPTGFDPPDRLDAFLDAVRWVLPPSPRWRTYPMPRSSLPINEGIGYRLTRFGGVNRDHGSRPRPRCPCPRP